MELARRLDDDLVADMDAAGMFSILVPGCWGGPGLGPRELNSIVEVIAHGDVSTAWVTSFYNLHNWSCAGSRGLCRRSCTPTGHRCWRPPSCRSPVRQSGSKAATG